MNDEDMEGAVTPCPYVSSVTPWFNIPDEFYIEREEDLKANACGCRKSA